MEEQMQNDSIDNSDDDEDVQSTIHTFEKLTVKPSPVESENPIMRNEGSKKRKGQEDPDKIAIKWKELVALMRDFSQKEDVKVCRNVDNKMICSDVDEMFGKPESSEGIDSGLEDWADGANNASCSRVIIKCQCKDRSSIIRQFDGTFVLEGSCIMRRYTESVAAKAIANEPLIRRERAQTRKSIPSETVALYITNPHILPQGVHSSRVNIGGLLVSLEDESGHMRHFFKKVIPGSPVEYMEIQTEDELLLCNGVLMVDKTTLEVIAEFAKITLDEELSMLTRRITNRRSKLDLDSPKDANHEYWQIRATITIDTAVSNDPILAQNAVVTMATQGDILKVDGNNVVAQNAYITTAGKYLYCNADGAINANPGLDSTDAAYTFEMFSYDMHVMDPFPTKKRARVFRHSFPSVSFLYVAEDGDIKLRKIPDDKFETPTENLIKNGDSSGDFAIRQTILYSEDLRKSQGEEVYSLEAYNRKQCFVALHASGTLMLHKLDEGHSVDPHSHPNMIFKVELY